MCATSLYVECPKCGTGNEHECREAGFAVFCSMCGHKYVLSIVAESYDEEKSE